MASEHLSLLTFAWMPTHRGPLEELLELFTPDPTESSTIWIDTYFAGIRLGALIFFLALYLLCVVVIPLVTMHRSSRSYAIRILAFLGAATVALITTLQSLVVGGFWLTVLIFSVGILASACSLVFIFWGTRVDSEAQEG